MNRYWTTDFWHDRHPGSDVVQQVFYSTNYYTSRAVGLIQNFSQQYWRRQKQVVDDRDLPNASRSNGLQEDFVAKTAGTRGSLWIHLAHQAVHSPIIDVPQWERTDQPQSIWNGVYADMLHVLDTSAENVTMALKAEQLWSETLMIVQSDNGGVGTHSCATLSILHSATLHLVGIVRSDLSACLNWTQGHKETITRYEVTNFRSQQRHHCRVIDFAFV